MSHTSMTHADRIEVYRAAIQLYAIRAPMEPVTKKIPDLVQAAFAGMDSTELEPKYPAAPLDPNSLAANLSDPTEADLWWNCLDDAHTIWIHLGIMLGLVLSDHGRMAENYTVGGL